MSRRTGIALATLIFLAAALIMAVFFAARAVDTSDPANTQSTSLANPKFPKIKGTSLLLEEVTVPDDLTGTQKLIVVSYDASQQDDVETWLPALEDMSTGFPDLAGYYVPLLPRSASDSALFIIGGMTLAAENDRDRQRTIVVFTDVDKFNELTDVPDKNKIRLFLLDANDQIVWRGAGGYGQSQIANLEAALKRLSGE